MSVSRARGQDCLQGNMDTTNHSRCQGKVDVKWELLWSGTAPFVSTLCLPTVTTHDQISKAIFTYSWGGSGLGARLYATDKLHTCKTLSRGPAHKGMHACLDHKACRLGSPGFLGSFAMLNLPLEATPPMGSLLCHHIQLYSCKQRNYM